MTQNNIIRYYLPSKAPYIFGAKTPGKTYNIQLDNDGEEIKAQFLGRGRFSTVFRYGNEAILYTFYGDYSKSLLSQAYREYGSGNPYLPEIRKMGSLTIEGATYGTKAFVYKAKFYRKCPKVHPTKRGRLQVHALQEAHDFAAEKFNGNIIKGNNVGQFNETIISSKCITGRLQEALEILERVSLEWGDTYIFDSFKVKNLGLDEKNRLILIDPMFDLDKIHKHQAAKRAMEKS